jgi:hypothetical protein
MSARHDDLDERDTPMTGTYARVIVVEALIVVALWILGRLFS